MRLFQIVLAPIAVALGITSLSAEPGSPIAFAAVLSGIVYLASLSRRG